MPKTGLQDMLSRARAELRQAEEELQAKRKHAEYWRQVVSGLVGLIEADAGSSEPSLFGPQPFTVRVADGAPPRGREAVRRVLLETRKPWKIPELAEEIERRGWMPGVASYRDSVAATVQRLVKDGVAERVGHGVYRYRLDKLPPPEDEDG